MQRPGFVLLTILLGLGVGCDDGPASGPPDAADADRINADSSAEPDGSIDAGPDAAPEVTLDAGLDGSALDGGPADAAPADHGSPDQAPPDMQPPDMQPPDMQPPDMQPVCVLDPEDDDPDFVQRIGCRADHEAVAAPPLVANLPGVRSAKTVVDRIDQNALYFQNSRRYRIHWEFASEHLSGSGLPIVPPLGQFNETEYYSLDRRFVLGALNYFEGPGIWAYEVAPYDTADAALMELAFDLIRDHHYAGHALRFHPTSDNVAREAARLPDDIPIVTTDELYAGIDYQPLNLATSIGRLRFLSTDDLGDQFLSFRDIAVLETVPIDLSVCVGTITDEFQTPLSHINVLAQNRGTPNMGLRGAFENPELRALEGRWVELTVGASEYAIREVTPEEADAWWQANRPAPVEINPPDLSVVDLRDIEEVLDVEGLGLRAALAASIPAFGGKASHYGAFPHIEDVEIPYPKAFVVPIVHYRRFMEQHGFDARVRQMIAHPLFRQDPASRARLLQGLRDDMARAPVDPELLAALNAKLAADYPGVRMKFRSSTNAEDLNGFTGAGLYTSAVADPGDPDRSVEDALRTVWASVWRLRAFDEREYRSISHLDVGMAVLAHRSFPDEDAQGVAITANIFDTSGLEPGYYINVQQGDISVVEPPAGVTSDQFVYHYDLPGQPIVYLGHSNVVPPGESVLTRGQVAELAAAMEAIHAYFDPLYGPLTPDHFYAMDIEFKFDSTGPDGRSALVIKQARPYPGRGN